MVNAGVQVHPDHSAAGRGLSLRRTFRSRSWRGWRCRGCGSRAGAGDAAEEDAGGLDGDGASDAGVEEDLRFEVEDVGWDDAATDGALPTVTSGVIFLMVAAETPALDKSLAEEYGRPETIFLAVAGPTPGRSSKSFSLAVFKSTGPAGALDAAGFAEEAADFVAVDFAGAAAGAALPKVTSGVIFLMVAAETPAFDKSLAEE